MTHITLPMRILACKQSLVRRHPLLVGKSGFSLIELIIAVGVLVILVGGGIAAFIRFNEKQQVLGAARELQQLLRTAQTKARAREIPSDAAFGCNVTDNRVVAYHVEANAGTDVRVVVVPACDNSLTGYDKPSTAGTVLLETNLPSAVALDEAIDLDFLALYGGVRNYDNTTDSEWTYQLSLGNYQVEFTISSTGEIGDVVEL